MAKCLECGKEFEAVRATAKYCSVTCRSKAHREVSVAGEALSVAENLSVASKEGLSVARVEKEALSVAEEVGTPAKVLDLVKDLHLNMGRDLGCTAWTADGIFIRDDIQIEQVRSIRRVVEARHGWPHREYDGPNAPYSTAKLASVGV